MIRNIFIDENQEFKIQEIIDDSKGKSNFKSVKIEIRAVDSIEELERIMKFVSKQVMLDFESIKEYGK